MTYKVHLTYFKPSGKYYSDGSFESKEGAALFEIFQQVRLMKIAGELPGISGSNWHVLIGVPDHPNDHPHLVPC